MSNVILYIIGGFFVVSGIDYVLGNKFNLGEKFEEGVKSMGVLALSMVGIYSLAPMISNSLGTVIIPIFNTLNLDPSIFAGSLLTTEMGGYQVAKDLALNSNIGLFSGVILASSLGTTISFTIPLGMGMISREDEKYFSMGIMAGMVTIPVTCIVGGICQGLNYKDLMLSILPVAVFSLLIGIGLLKIPNALMKVFGFFGRAIISLSVIGLILQGIQIIFHVQPLSGLLPYSEGLNLVGKMAIVLGGSYPMLAVINYSLKKYFDKFGEKIGINGAAVTGLIGNLASNLLAFCIFKDMDAKGKVLCTAYGVSGAFMFGGQFGFVSGVAPEMVKGFIFSKLIGGMCSIPVALWIYNRQTNRKVEASMGAA
ncbi:ethanolamine utilization protein EutH [Clostridium magnum]|uniref:Ethanolamine utilization protein, EutH n=1 Tax=Clostridium magnum DSM 2767 TaxID=1121326 RepID=A0A161XAQ3_9CLOT|nr:ethanolamine utilization protein EutH [Clostridium magnum]KZL91336.1 ethanolamine utilization protein, EutH [Clostridium magnum DSM 2767]SHH38428.1 ethanolamine transporter [Clostridium magnum DSM 2767]